MNANVLVQISAQRVRLVIRRFLFLPFLTLSAVAYAGATPTLTVYSYDSFAAHGGLGPEVAKIFEKTCGCKLKILPSGDGAQLVSRLQIDEERGHPDAAIIVGLDESAFERAKPWVEAWETWTPKGYARLPSFLKQEKNFLPFDYGYFAFMADTEALAAQKLSAPARFEDLLKPEMKRNLILEDPRTSTPGLAFVLYADEQGTGVWPKLRTQWLALATGWDAAYGLFLKKEAPLVWSYTTSQAYHEEHGDQAHRYRALILDGAAPLQIEGAALVKGAFAGEGGAAKLALAKSFLEALLSKEVQSLVASHNWMYPVDSKVPLPASFKDLPTPAKKVRLPFDVKSVDLALKQWSDAVQR